MIVGGTALVGARGDYWRTVLGALLLTELTTLLIGYGFGEASQQILCYGLAILVVVPLYGRDRRGGGSRMSDAAKGAREAVRCA